jgi:hypothetical protein
MRVYYAWQVGDVVRFNSKEYTSVNEFWCAVNGVKHQFTKLSVIPASCIKRLCPDYIIDQITDLPKNIKL